MSSDDVSEVRAGAVDTAAGPPVRRTTRVMWWFGAVSAGVSAGAAVQLLVGATRTEDFFAWTIAVPASAAFIGLFYLASAVMGVLALRQPLWAPARMALVPVVMFVALVLLVTLLHLETFHLFAGGPLARAAAWVWLAVYLITPPGYLFAFWWQGRAGGARPPHTAPLAAVPRAVLAAVAVPVGVLGVALLVAPRGAGALWPWSLTALTGRMTGATLLGVSLLAASIVLGNDRVTGRTALTGLMVCAAVTVAVPLGYGQTVVDWLAPSTWVYLAVAVVVLLAAAIAARGPAPARGVAGPAGSVAPVPGSEPAPS